MSATDPIAVLKAIVAEVAGPGDSVCSFSSLPPNLVHDARQAIAAHESDDTPPEWRAQEQLLLAKLAKAGATIQELRATHRKTCCQSLTMCSAQECAS